MQMHYLYNATTLQTRNGTTNRITKSMIMDHKDSLKAKADLTDAQIKVEQHTPNAKTRRAMKKARALLNSGSARFASADELFNSLEGTNNSVDSRRLEQAKHRK